MREPMRLVQACLVFLRFVTAAAGDGAAGGTLPRGEGGLWQGLPRPREEDFEGLKIFIYDLPASFNADLQAEFEAGARDAGSNCDFMLSGCTERKWCGHYSQSRQRGMEVIILRKLLASPERTRDPREADLFVVPYLAATERGPDAGKLQDCWLGGFHVGCPDRRNHDAEHLFAHLPYYGPATRHRHLFLASADMHSLPLHLQAQSILVTKGASWGNRVGHFVVPTAVTDSEFQPSSFRDLGLDGRDILFWLAQTPNSAMRYEIQRQLIAFDLLVPEEQRGSYGRGLAGGRAVHVTVAGRPAGRLQESLRSVPAPADMVAEMLRSVFCPAPPTETSGGMKRMLDVVLAGCLPVVPAFPTVWGSGISWWKQDGVPVEWALPFSWEIDWRRLAVEVPVERLYGDAAESGDGTSWPLVDACLSLKPEEVEAKRSYLLQVRGRLLYDLEGGSRDAFSTLMDGIRAALPKLQPSAVPHGAPVVCDFIERSWLHMKMPEKVVGQGVGIDKAWSHSFGDLACVPASEWRTPASMLTPEAQHGFLPAVATVERFFTSRMLRSSGGSAVFLQERTSTEVLAEDWPAVMATAPLAHCRHREIPLACHDALISDPSGSGEIGYQLCGRTFKQPPVTFCRLLPALVPVLPPVALAAASHAHWEVVTFACGVGGHLEALAEELQVEGWTEKLPGHSLQAVLYDACAQEQVAASQHADAERGRQPAGQVLFEHTLALLHAKRLGRTVPDFVVLINDRWIKEALLDDRRASSSSRWPRPREVLARAAAFAAGRPDDGRSWLWSLGSPPGEMEPCEEFFLQINTPCGIPEALAKSTPLAMAFPSELLGWAMAADMEVAASVATVKFDGGGSTPLSLLLVLLARAAQLGGAAVEQEEYKLSGLALEELSETERCTLAFGEGAFLSRSGAAVRPRWALDEQAAACARAGGTYFLWRTQLNESSHEPSWPPDRALMFQAWLGSLPWKDEEWLPFQHFGVCSPAPPLCGPQAWAALGWHLLMRHKFDLLLILASLPAPSAVEVRPWTEQQAAEL